MIFLLLLSFLFFIFLLAWSLIFYFFLFIYYLFIFIADGRLYSWGSNQHGQCGLGFNSIGVSEPLEITALKGVNIVQITCGETHSMALDSNNNVYTYVLDRFFFPF